MFCSFHVDALKPRCPQINTRSMQLMAYTKIPKFKVFLTTTTMSQRFPSKQFFVLFEECKLNLPNWKNAWNSIYLVSRGCTIHKALLCGKDVISIRAKIPLKASCNYIFRTAVSPDNTWSTLLKKAEKIKIQSIFETYSAMLFYS